MIEEVVSIDLPVHERLTVRKNKLIPDGYTGKEKRVSIATGIYGDELDGQFICYEVIRRVKREPEKLKGRIDLYPDVNPLGLDIGSRGIPMFDLDMNSIFPGDNNGAMNEYVAAGIVNDIIGSDFCLDIHSSNIFLKEMPQVRLNKEHEDILMPYAKMLNVDFIWIYPSITVKDSTLAYSLNNLGVPTLAVEMGVGHRISTDYCRQFVDGIFNMLVNMGIWDDKPIDVREPIISTKGTVDFINACETGVFVSAIDRMGTISMGTHIGDIVEPIEGKITQRIESPADGIIFTIRENPVVYKGDLIARVHGGKSDQNLKV